MGTFETVEVDSSFHGSSSFWQFLQFLQINILLDGYTEYVATEKLFLGRPPVAPGAEEAP